MSAKRNGFSLIEVMVSLVILTVGLVGIFNLHIVAKRGSYESFQQTQASYYANDIINRMRMNRSELINYQGTYSGISSAPAKSCDVNVGGNSICTSVETRVWDLYQWERMFQGDNEKSSGTNVGGLDTSVACIDVSGRDVTVVVTWRGVRASSDGLSEAGTFAKSCGSSSDRRRALVLETAII
ncbi:type IV pilus modification protein PilV [Shewanella sp. 1_MG-2023]|uniref:type IV pilus modification protein PilV n=1 Tax=unclassified Shewanella TaxID=196818 RepID=UPI000C82A744|nr:MULTISPECIES: type IV pilus modification protein PilV [unclassified Shewanella]MDO6610057.1 type IV pilus modification protein PilV [Shewanella sp. 7_MG-2023]MDO6769801.1 type IV pilus modification protein PilV [Shewanella sp. 2_MG-2023]MDO6792865.1 type IV pilus modification protein PilV [Shewanella sp. 1_MG-2023]